VTWKSDRRSLGNQTRVTLEEHCAGREGVTIKGVVGWEESGGGMLKGVHLST